MQGADTTCGATTSSTTAPLSVVMEAAHAMCCDGWMEGGAQLVRGLGMVQLYAGTQASDGLTPSGRSGASMPIQNMVKCRGLDTIYTMIVSLEEGGGYGS